ncbi:response regulator [Salimicrobium halophilum]|uniref:Two-component system, CitB family, response regulator CitT n=1 Tax=Salimicrobium halophilum TaxID=86666 RepID=A0A1G8SEX8_9BACI|nr:response regulator [Salimicrobium halophilum]SDJ27250.1 two-component system, CitB family, response regulator CitT [Salimicrobium halophilum]
MYHVLIAEDDFRVAGIHEEYLKQIPEMSLAAKALNAKEVMEALATHHIDLLLLDVYMPDELGTGLLHRIREEHPNVDIIMITAATDKAFLEKAIRYGVQDYLIKPVTLDNFRTSMDKYKQKKETLHRTDEVNEEVLKKMFGTSPQPEEIPDLPTGIDAGTLKKVQQTLASKEEGITADETGKELGASRTTARRYLEYLVGENEAYSEQVYGIVGRPERRYFPL